MKEQLKENIKLISTVAGIAAFVFTVVGFILGVYVTQDTLGDNIKHNRELLEKIDETVTQHNLLLLNLKPSSDEKAIGK